MRSQDSFKVGWVEEIPPLRAGKKVKGKREKWQVKTAACDVAQVFPFTFNLSPFSLLSWGWRGTSRGICSKRNRNTVQHTNSRDEKTPSGTFVSSSRYDRMNVLER
jgi:hypothetical protein